MHRDVDWWLRTRSRERGVYVTPMRGSERDATRDGTAGGGRFSATSGDARISARTKEWVIGISGYGVALLRLWAFCIK